MRSTQVRLRSWPSILTLERSLNQAAQPRAGCANMTVYICSGSIETVLTTIEDPTQLSWTNPFSNVANTIEGYNVPPSTVATSAGKRLTPVRQLAGAPSTYLDVDY